MTHENLLNDIRDALAEIAQGTLRPAHFVAQEALTRLDAFLQDVRDELKDHEQRGDSKGAWECLHFLHTATTKGNDDE